MAYWKIKTDTGFELQDVETEKRCPIDVTHSLVWDAISANPTVKHIDIDRSESPFPGVATVKICECNCHA